MIDLQNLATDFIKDIEESEKTKLKFVDNFEMDFQINNHLKLVDKPIKTKGTIPKTKFV